MPGSSSSPHYWGLGGQAAIGGFLFAVLSSVPFPVRAGGPVSPAAAREAKGYTHCIGQFTTKFDGSEIARNTNIRLAARRMNGKIIAPDAEFSFNETVGPRETEASDFERAPVLTAKGKELGLGGGICQVAGTLYNAALLANLSILERHPHSRVVRYLPPGRDATVSQDGTDLVFKNGSPRPLRLRAVVQGNHLTFSFWSKEAPKSRVRILTERRRAATPGMAVAVVAFRIVERNGAIVRRERLSEDNYRGTL